MDKKQRFWKKPTTFDMAFMGLLLAVDIVLSRLLSVTTPVIKISFAFVAVAVAAYYFGCMGGVLVAGLGDLIGALAFPVGPYFPGYTLTAVVLGFIFGILLYRTQSFWKIFSAVLTSQIVCTLILNSLWISITYTKALWPVIASRLVQSGIMIPVQIIVLVPLFKLLLLRLKRYNI